jgi:hypothetical protein
VTHEELIKFMQMQQGKIDTLTGTLRFVAGHLDGLRDVWGDEGLTRTVVDRIKATLAEVEGTDE